MDDFDKMTADVCSSSISCKRKGNAFRLYRCILDAHLHIHNEDEAATKKSVADARHIVKKEPELLTTLNNIKSFLKDGYSHKNSDGERLLTHFRQKGNDSLPLHWVTYLGIDDMVKLFLDKYPRGSSTKTGFGALPIVYAVYQGFADISRMLLTYYPDAASLQNKCGHLPIHTAAGNGHVNTVRVLLQIYPIGASISTKRGDLALHLAARYGHADVIHVLLESYPVAITIQNKSGRLPLAMAVESGHVEPTNALLEAYPEAASICLGPSIIKSRRSRLKRIRCWWRRKTRKQQSQIQKRYGRLPLYCAALRGHLDIIKILLQYYPGGACFMDKNGEIPIHAAAKEGHLECTKTLLESYPKGAFAQDRRGKLPLHFSTHAGHVGVTRVLLDAFPDGAFVQDFVYGDLPLHGAAYQGHLDVICELLDKIDYRGLFVPMSIPLWQIRRNTTWSVILDNCGREDTVAAFKAARNQPILHEALGVIPLDEVHFMIESIQVNLDVKDSSGRSALQIAIENAAKHKDQWESYYKPIVKMIVSTALDKRKGDHTALKCENKMMTDGKGRQLLHIALDLGLHWECIEMILKVHVNASSIQDTTTGLFPFMLASVGANSDLRTVYEMFRFQPDILNML